MKKIIYILIAILSAASVKAQWPVTQVKPPEKDVKRLALIPSRPPTRNEMVLQVQQSMQVVKKGIPAPRLEELKKITSAPKVETIHDAAVASLYGSDPKEAIFLMMTAVSEAPDSLQMVNNLAAMLNMHGAQHKAIPLLQYCLEKIPNSSIVLNNLGQGFMGLGELFKAADYFNRCLSIDSLNIEANHSMGMLHLFKKEYDAATKYFERELSVAYRRTSLAMAYKTGKKFNLRELTKQRNRRNGKPQKDYFEEINLGKFSFPSMPSTAQEINERKKELAEYGASVQAEALTWMGRAGQVNMKYGLSEGDKMPGLYSDLAEAMLDELSKEFSSKFLIPFTDHDGEVIKEIVNTHLDSIIKIKCKQPPPGSSLEVQAAFERDCCETRKRPIANKLVSELGSQIGPIMRMGQQRWKSYINQLIAIAELDPTVSNQMLVYNAVAGYFSFLSLGAIYFNAGEINNMLTPCIDNYVPVDLDSLVTADHNWKVQCPAWLNIEVDFGGPVLKADCSKYVLEGGGSIAAGFEHEFGTGKSTLLLGPGSKLEFLGGMIKMEAKSQLFISFDRNKEFADFGVKNTGEVSISGTPVKLGGIKLGGNLAGIEISNSMSIVNGYTEGLEKKGFFTQL